MTMAVVWAAAWLLLGATGLVPGTVGAIVGVLAFHGIFALGETILQSAMPAVINDMAPDHLRGRYNAAYSAAFQVGNVSGPVAAGFLLEHHLAGGFIGVVVIGCLGVVVALRAMDRRISPEVNGVGGGSEDVTQVRTASDVEA